MPLPQPEPKSGGSPAGRGPRRPLRDVGRGGGPASLSARCPGLAATGGPVGRALRARGRRGAAPAGCARPSPSHLGGEEQRRRPQVLLLQDAHGARHLPLLHPAGQQHAGLRTPPTQSAGSRPAGRQAGASRPSRRAAKGDTVAHASRPASLRGPPGCGRPCPAPARPPRELPSPRWARSRLPHVCPLGPSRGPPCACGRPAPEPGRSAKWPVSPARAQPCRGPWLPPLPTSPPSRPWARGALPAVNASDQWVPSQGSDRGLLAQPGGLNP